MFPDTLKDLGLIYTGITPPFNQAAGDPWFNPATGGLSIWDGTGWVAITGGASTGIVDGGTVNITQVPPLGAVGTIYQTQMGAIPNPAWGLNAEFPWVQGGSAVIRLTSSKYLVLSNALDAGNY